MAMWYLTIYAGISVAQTLLELVRGFSSNFLAIRCARHLHNGMLAKLLRRVDGSNLRAHSKFMSFVCSWGKTSWQSGCNANRTTAC